MNNNDLTIIPMPGVETRVATVILADGTYPAAAVPAALLAGAERVVCCDGAAVEFARHGGIPYAVVGDLDSLDDNFRENYSGIMHRDPDQETNDLTKAVAFCLEKGFRDLAIVGATGKREDHTIGNIGLLGDYAERLPGIFMATEYGVFHPMSGNACFESFSGQQMSIFVFSPRTLVTTRNLKYPLHKTSLRAWWQGTLNESTGDNFGLQTAGQAVVYRLYRS